MSVPANSSLAVSLIVALTLTCTPARAQSPVTALAFAPHETRLVAGSQSGIEIRRWPELQPVARRDLEIRSIHDLAFSPDSSRLLVGGGAPSEYGEWQIVSWPALEVVAKSISHDDSIDSVAWLADDRFVTAGADSRCIVWKLSGETAEQVVAIDGHSRSVLSVEALRENNLFVTAGVDQVLRVWPADLPQVESPQPIRKLDNHTGAVCALALCPVQRPLPLLASASVDKTVRLWQPTIGRLVKFARSPVEPTCLAWSRDGTRLAAGCADGKLRIINPATVQVDQTCHGVDGWIYSVCAATDGSFVVGGTHGLITRVVPSSE
ncbi:WD domain, G-beta repeat [Posidoniimonas polymericola]|uniref:WD domain, G-beta repeat n=1 Tax=Posidoniimonas polymericola TaxID=2528002 RepID=A0A5C5YMB9_9BACT|nr:hypothetical protein [Posidoniimonas polymericola]TWT75995.1 WD domain, G-beta repeat [Posidoniimonas polymericola]